jgi:deferrochelatase/peroxidase EfeB
VRLADEIAQVRWAQTGFMPNFGTTQTPRNLMGFKDGTNSPWLREPAIMRKFVWVGHEGPDWMRDGSYVVVRRIRIALEHWDRSTIDFQEQTVGRHKESGAPIGKKDENDPLDLERADKDGNLVIAENAHVRLAAAATNDGAQIFRRPYSYNDGLKRQGMEYDAGLFFLCYQRDPRTGFIKIFENMAKFDMMNQFVTHVGSGLFACPGGVAQGEFIGQRLFTGA